MGQPSGSAGAMAGGGMPMQPPQPQNMLPQNMQGAAAMMGQPQMGQPMGQPGMGQPMNPQLTQRQMRAQPSPYDSNTLSTLMQQYMQRR